MCTMKPKINAKLIFNNHMNGKIDKNIKGVDLLRTLSYFIHAEVYSLFTNR